jgi:PAS domain S-box-containing protein
MPDTDHAGSGRDLAGEQLWRHAPIGMAVVDARMRFVRVNDRFAEMSGVPVEALVGHRVSEVLPRLVEPVEGTLLRVIERGEALRNIPIWGETDAQPGVRRYWVGQLLPLRDDDGRVVAVSAVVEEVTAERRAQAERERAERQLRESRQQLALALEAGQLGFWDWDLRSGRVVFGGQWAAMLGESLGDIAQHVDSWTARVHPDDLARATELVQAHLQGRTPFYECEHRMRTTSGDWIWVLDRGRVVERDEAGQPVRAIGTHLDVTDRRRAIDALHAADRRKDEFLAMLGHELRNPMAGVTNAVRVLSADPSLAPSSRAAVAIASRQLGQLRRLVDDLLDVSRISSGHVRLAPESVPAAAAVRAAIDDARPHCESRGHTLRCEPVDPALAVRADPARLAQILDNLLSNACKYTPPGGTITVSVQPRGAMVELRVADTGIGLAAESVEAVFELFLQEPSGRDLSQGGLGIGLALVRQLAALHGGSAHAESAGPGKGSTFVVRLPQG